MTREQIIDEAVRRADARTNNSGEMGLLESARYNLQIGVPRIILLNEDIAMIRGEFRRVAAEHG